MSDRRRLPAVANNAIVAAAIEEGRRLNSERNPLRDLWHAEKLEPCIQVFRRSRNHYEVYRKGLCDDDAAVHNNAFEETLFLLVRGH